LCSTLSREIAVDEPELTRLLALGNLINADLLIPEPTEMSVFWKRFIIENPPMPM
jgi:hypothetical protein